MVADADLEAKIAGLTGLSPLDAQAIVKMARVDPSGAAQVLVDYQAAAAPGTPSFVEDAWRVLQVALGVAMPAIGAVETLAGVPGFVKTL